MVAFSKCCEAPKLSPFHVVTLHPSSLKRMRRDMVSMVFSRSKGKERKEKKERNNIETKRNREGGSIH